MVPTDPGTRALVERLEALVAEARRLLLVTEQALVSSDRLLGESLLILATPTPDPPTD